MIKIASVAIAPGTATFIKRNVVHAALQILIETTSEELEDDFRHLVDLGILTRQIHDSPSKSAEYSFFHWLMPRVLQLRTLESQRVEMRRCLEIASVFFDSEFRKAFLEKTRGKLSATNPIKQGWLLVHKKNIVDPQARKLVSILASTSTWKKRFVSLSLGRIDFYKDEIQNHAAESAFFDKSVVISRISDIGGRSDVIRIDADDTEKHGRQGGSREFILSPMYTSSNELDDWLFKLRLAAEGSRYLDNGC